MKWKVVPFSNMTIGEKYKVEHYLEFHEITAWYRVYVGRFYKYNVKRDKAFFQITSSYDFIEKMEPHVGPKWFHNNICVYEMVRQGQISMERRAYHMILGNLIEGILPPSFL